MDNVTHSLTGLMLSRAGLDRLTPRAALILMLSANAPDLDSISSIAGVTTYLDWHRGPTHGLPMLPFMALLPVAVAGLWRRPAGFSWGYAYLLACIGLLSHLLMDWTNIYGIRLLAPVSEEWFRLDVTAVIDPWIWLFLGLAVTWPLLARLVNAEIGARSNPGSGIARFALALVLLYDFGRYVIHNRAVETLNSRLYAGGPPTQIAALPDYLNPLRWTGLVELPGRWEVHALNVAREFDPSSARLWYQAAASSEVDEARRQEPFRALGRFSKTLLWQAVQLPGENAGSEVRLIDLRFGEPAEGSFTAIARIFPGGRAEAARFQFRGPGAVMRPH
jgi:inner membrane protein